MAKARAGAEVRVDARLCKGTEGCGICIHVCSEGVLGPSAQLSSRGVHPVAVLHPERCTGCESCALYCPDLAVTVVGREAGRYA